jgi:hypothetical protein
MIKMTDTSRIASRFSLRPLCGSGPILFGTGWKELSCSDRATDSRTLRPVSGLSSTVYERRADEPQPKTFTAKSRTLVSPNNHRSAANSGLACSNWGLLVNNGKQAVSRSCSLALCSVHNYRFVYMYILRPRPVGLTGEDLGGCCE